VHVAICTNGNFPDSKPLVLFAFLDNVIMDENKEEINKKLQEIIKKKTEENAALNKILEKLAEEIKPNNGKL